MVLDGDATFSITIRKWHSASLKAEFLILSVAVPLEQSNVCRWQFSWSNAIWPTDIWPTQSLVCTFIHQVSACADQNVCRPHCFRPKDTEPAIFISLYDRIIPRVQGLVKVNLALLNRVHTIKIYDRKKCRTVNFRLNVHHCQSVRPYSYTYRQGRRLP